MVRFIHKSKDDLKNRMNKNKWKEEKHRGEEERGEIKKRGGDGGRRYFWVTLELVC